MTDRDEPLTARELQLMIDQRRPGVGPLSDDTRLCDVAMTGVDRLWLVAAIEDRYGIDFPADLMTALETVGDLTHYTTLKVQQRHGDDGSHA